MKLFQLSTKNALTFLLVLVTAVLFGQAKPNIVILATEEPLLVPVQVLQDQRTHQGK